MYVSADYWVSPGAIKYTKKQVCYFILPFLANLERGEYPPKPLKSGYTTCIIPPPRVQHYQAGFIPAVEVSAEINARLAGLPAPERRAVLAVYAEEVDIYDYARRHNMTDNQLRLMLRDAVDYLSGELRKPVRFVDWLENRGIDRLLNAIAQANPGKPQYGAV